MNPSILVVIEHKNGEILPAAWEAVACANEISFSQPAEIKLVILGNDVESLAQKTAWTTGIDIIAIETFEQQTYNSEVYKSSLAEVLKERPFSYLCVPGSTQGNDFAPGLSMRLGTSCIAGVEKVIPGENGIGFLRSINGGKINTEIQSETASTIILVQPGSYKPQQIIGTTRGNIDRVTVDFSDHRIKNLSIQKTPGDNSVITDAPIIISAGRGIGDEENLELIKRFSMIFPKSAIGGSRPLCDLGWLENSQQIGITGATVDPELYIACGISGATQHTMGMKGAGFIVSINSDPFAAIFNISDLCIVEDLNEFLAEFIDVCEDASKTG